jgi:hypothetical protein
MGAPRWREAIPPSFRGTWQPRRPRRRQAAALPGEALQLDFTITIMLNLYAFHEASKLKWLDLCE